MSEMHQLVDLPLFKQLNRHMEEAYQALSSIDYSGDKLLLGWNIRYHKVGRTLCRVYPRARHFHMLLVVGPKEKQRVEDMLPGMSAAFQEVYQHTKEGMGQRWLVLTFDGPSPTYDDALKVIRIRRESR